MHMHMYVYMYTRYMHIHTHSIGAIIARIIVSTISISRIDVPAWGTGPRPRTQGCKASCTCL